VYEGGVAGPGAVPAVQPVQVHRAEGGQCVRHSIHSARNFALSTVHETSRYPQSTKLRVIHSARTVALSTVHETSRNLFKVHKNENFLAPILNFVLFHC